MNIDQLTQKQLNDPYNLKGHDELLSVLRLHKLDCAGELLEARLHKLKYFMLEQDEIHEMLEDLMIIEDMAQRQKFLEQFYQLILKEYPTVYYWLQYLEFAAKVQPREELQRTMISALNDTAYDFDGSHKVWNKVLSFMEEIYNDTKDPDDLDTLLKLYLKRISVPHKYLQESYNETSAFVTKHFPDEYNSYMTSISKLFGESQSRMIYYEKHEINLSNRFDDPNFWSDYIRDVAKYGKPQQFSCIFYRSLLASDKDWAPVWLSYIYSLYSKEAPEDELRDVLLKFVRAFPNSPISYAELIRNSVIFEERSYCNDFNDAKNRIKYLGLMRTSSYDDWKVLALALLTNDPSDQDIANYFEFALENNDVYNSVEKLVVSVYEAKDVSTALEHVDKIVASFPEKYDVWMFAFNFYVRHKMGYEAITGLFQRGMESVYDMDFPDRFLQEQLRYEQVYGGLEAQRSVLIRADEIMKEILQGGMDDTQVQRETESASKKRQLEDDEENEPSSNKRLKNEQDPVRNREELCVKVSNVSESATESGLVEFFEDCGEINSVNIYSSDEGVEAILEFTTKQSVLAALTKSHKQFDTKEILVKRMLNSILWVTNFPPKMTQESLRHLFSQTGKVVSIRFPIQKSNKVRRFCYIEYSEPESAKAAATRFNGTPLKDDDNKNYKLIVKMSDSHAKKPVPVIKREVYISNISFKVTKEELTQYFEQCGDIENVVLPLKEEMKKKGNANGGFGFVIFKSDLSVSRALKLDGTKFQNRPMNVKPSNKAKPETVDSFNKPTSIVVGGFDSKITKDQIESFLKEKLDTPYTKLLYIPTRESVVLQFSSIDESGTASMKLDATKFNDSTLSITSINEFQKRDHKKLPRPTSSKPPMFIPQQLQRRK